MSKRKQPGNSIIYKLRFVAVALVIAGVVGGVSAVSADKYDEKINALNAENDNARSVISDLTTKADDYQVTINKKQAQISSLQNQIAANQAKQSQLEQQITARKKEIAGKKVSLAADIKAMYIDGQMSTIEELATSRDLSEYVDKEEYRTSVQNQLNAKITEIASLQARLEKHKRQVDQVIATTQAQSSQLASQKAEQDKLLAYNEGQRASYNQQIGDNNQRIQELRAQQLAANARFIGGGSYAAGTGPACGGGYPGKWCNIPQDSVLDDWGMYNRECVSYTAFRVAASGRYIPWGLGNANQWDDNARARGFRVDSNPRPGDVAISNSGYYGHAMYVESVSGNNIFVSQYNAALNGRYSTKTVSKYGLVFIHF